jgi:hypothetical protein
MGRGDFLKVITKARQFVAATSVGPLGLGYKAVYEIVARATARWLRTHPEVLAIYLKRGAAKGDLVPGVSDIDINIVTRNPLPYDNEIRRSYQRLADRFLLLDRSLFIYSQQEFLDCYPNLVWAFRFHEGIHTWRLLYGADVVRRLKPLDGDHLEAALYYELKTWWSHFALFLIGERHCQSHFESSVFVYKAFAEIVKQVHALTTGSLEYSRSEGMVSAMENLTERERHVATDLQGYANRNFQAPSDSLLSDSPKVLLEILQRFHREFSDSHRFAEFDETSVCEETQFVLDRCKNIEVNLRNELADGDEPFRGELCVLPAPVEFRWMDDVVVLVEIDDPGPNLRPLFQRLYQAAEKIKLKQFSKIHVFISINGTAAYRVTPDYSLQWDKSFLSPFCNPELFTLRQKRLGLKGSGLRVWSSYVSWSLENTREVINNAWTSAVEQGRAGNLAFLRWFWKSLQVELMVRSRAEGRGAYFLSTSSVRQEAQRRYADSDLDWEFLEAAYTQELSGIFVNLSSHKETALRFIRENISSAPAYSSIFKQSAVKEGNENDLRVDAMS